MARKDSFNAVPESEQSSGLQGLQNILYHRHLLIKGKGQEWETVSKSKLSEILVVYIRYLGK